VVWQEAGASDPGRIFVRRFVANAWQTVGRQENCGNNEAACALILDPQRDAQRPRIASGRLTHETMRALPCGAGSPALDLQWVLVFEDPAFHRDYVQAVNLVYDGGQETGFIQAGEISVGPQIQLPLVANQ
jgi:hypothetical protein